MLNTLWLGFFMVAAVSALAQWLVGGNAQIFAAMVESLFAMAKLLGRGDGAAVWHAHALAGFLAHR
ncbi:MAG: hypothetical protein HEQ37_05260 [Acidovorax sp.]|nr:hypothetical protein [Acidovorax sp.]